MPIEDFEIILSKPACYRDVINYLARRFHSDKIKEYRGDGGDVRAVSLRKWIACFGRDDRAVESLQPIYNVAPRFVPEDPKMISGFSIRQIQRPYGKWLDSDDAEAMRTELAFRCACIA